MAPTAFRQRGSDDVVHPAHEPAMRALSVVIPVFNERDNIMHLVQELVRALRNYVHFEIICVDDGSTDGTREVLAGLKHPGVALRVVAHAHRCGQSAAIRTGVRYARYHWVATLDGDGQNAPVDILRLIDTLEGAEAGTKLIAGWRVDRRDPAGKRWASRWANRIRRAILRDATPDTGCGIKLFERAAFLDLPYFDHMHRYLPALMQRAGWRIISVPVSHRPRTSGISKYNNLHRALVGIRDLMGVAWLVKRSHIPDVMELDAEKVQ